MRRKAYLCYGLQHGRQNDKRVPRPRENSAVVGYIGVGVLQGGGEPLDANINIQKLKVPVVDIYADATPLNLASAQNRKSLVGDRYTQVHMRCAGHAFRGYEEALAEAVVAWLKERQSKQ